MKNCIGMSRAAMAREDLRDSLRGARTDAERVEVLFWNRLLGRTLKDQPGYSLGYARLNWHNRVPVIHEDGTRAYGTNLLSASTDAARAMRVAAAKQAALIERDPVAGLSSEQLQEAHREVRNEEVRSFAHFFENIGLLNRIAAEMARRGVPIDGDLVMRRPKKHKASKPVDDPEVMGTLGNDDVALASYRRADAARANKGGLFPKQRVIELTADCIRNWEAA